MARGGGSARVVRGGSARVARTRAMGGACSNPVTGGLGQAGGRSVGGGGGGAPSAVSASTGTSAVAGQTKVVPALSREDVLKREAARERERTVGRTIDIIWTHFDSDGNGELDQSEFAALVSETMKGGVAHLEEFSAVEIDELMRMIDTDGDGSISRAEFKELILGLTGLTEDRRDEIAMLSIVMCKAMMFVEAVVNQSKEGEQNGSKQKEQEPEEEVEVDEGKMQEGKESEHGQQREGKKFEPDGLSSDSAARRNFSWRPPGGDDGLVESKPSSPAPDDAADNDDDKNNQTWELLPV